MDTKTKSLARMVRHHAEEGNAGAMSLVRQTLWLLSFIENNVETIPAAKGDELCVQVRGRTLSLERLLELVAREAGNNVSITGGQFRTARETEEDVGGMLGEIALMLEGTEAPLGLRAKVHGLVSAVTDIPNATAEYAPETHTDIRRINTWLIKQRAEMEAAVQSKRKPVPAPVRLDTLESSLTTNRNNISPEEASALRRTLTSEMTRIG